MRYQRSSACIGGFFLLLAASGARADECASNGPIAYSDVPRDGAAAPPNTRFRVLVAPGCGGVENGPEHQFRVIDPTGTEIPSHREPWARSLLELVPDADLPPGQVELQVRRPLSTDALGEWERLVRVRIAGERDEHAPAFAGIESGTATAERESVPLSPCEATEGDVVLTRLEFAAAADAPRDHDELLYRLDRRHPGDATWDEWRTFRPTPDRETWFFSWSTWEREAWAATWEYRIAARDIAGNETVGEKTVTVTAPPRPGAEAPAAPETPDHDGLRPPTGAGSDAGAAEAAPPPRETPRGCTAAAGPTRSAGAILLVAAVAAWSRARLQRNRQRSPPGRRTP
ncbi:MAG: hypothetical protein HY907_16070 [Deltaproteobacteria bacterium]|nr:hypothetical protein [Deltaproteobacteria bacterium]